ncbi:MAG TPA: arsenite methyltransferase [Anaerolineales bacterium]|nr:arsenite methyltransferase [Anaerolineales bacterium]
MSTTQTSNPIRDAVREHYAARAVSSTSCCSPADNSSDCCGPESKFYSLDLIAELPTDVAEFSLGCGDAVSLAALQPGETVVDLGSGGGLECFIAAKQVGETGHVIGVDMTPEMLTKAREAGARMGLANVEFREGFIEEMPVEGGTVDVIMSNCVINLSPDKPRVLGEMHRVLKSGGRIAISDIVTKGQIPDALKVDMELWSACASGALPVAEWEEGLQTLGFTDIQIVPNGQTHEWLSKLPVGMPFSAAITARKS